MRIFVFLLVLANLIFFAWTQGYIGQAESPDAARLSQQFAGDRLRIVSRDQPPPVTTPPPPAKKAEPEPEKCLAWSGLSAADADAAVATACHPVGSAEEFFNPNIVKVVCDVRGHALYFSRAPIPWPRDAFAADRTQLPKDLPAKRHIGIYAYRCGFLRRYGALSPSPLEEFEALEQLRVLWHGFQIRVAEIMQAPEAGVDTPEDLQRARQRFTEV